LLDDLLDEKCADAFAPVMLLDLHVQVRKRPVVMKQESACRHDLPVHLQDIIAHRFDSVLEDPIV
jgi:hypothetical protein